MANLPAALPDPDQPAPPVNIAGIQAQGAALHQSSVARGNQIAQASAANGPGDPSLAARTPQPGEFGSAGSTPASPENGEATPGADLPTKVTDVNAAPKPATPAEEPEEPSVGGFIKSLVRGSARELGAGVMEAGAATAHSITLAADTLWHGAANQAAAEQNEFGPTEGAQTPTETEQVAEQGDKAIFGFNDKYVKPAIEHWQPAEESGAIARGLHQASNMVAYAPYGASGTVAFVTNAFSHTATSNIDAGMNTKAAVADATVDAVSNLALMKLLGKDLLGKFKDQIPTDMIRRIVSAIPIGDMVNMGSDLTKKFLLEMSGNHAAAQKIDVTQHVSNIEEFIQNAIFGAVGGQRSNKETPGAPPPPAAEAVKPPEPVPPPPPPPPESRQTVAPQTRAQDLKAPASSSAVAGQPPSPVSAQTAPVADHPSAEPAKQIRAQLVDMNRSATPRTGVLISPDTQAHLDALPDDHEHAAPVQAQIEQARAQGRSVQTPVGELITKTKQIAVQATGQLSAGRDPQEVIGKITGAGDGKRPDQTEVVQGRETDGTVTSETAVNPTERGAAVQAMVDQGKIPVITTPQDVLNERHRDTVVEKQEAQAGAGEGGSPEKATPEIAAPAAPKEAVSVKEGMLKGPTGAETPVHVVGEGGPGKMKVQPLDENGEPGEAREVPAEQVRTAKGASALEQLPAALEAHANLERPANGRVHAAKVEERQQNAMALAEVVGKAAKEAAGKGADEKLIERANKAVRETKNLGYLSKDDIEKGRFTGHTAVSAHAAELRKIGRLLTGKPEPGDEETVTPAQAVLKMRTEKRAARAGSDNPTAISERMEKARQTQAAKEATRPDFSKYPETGFPKKEPPKKEGPPTATAQETARFEALKDRFLAAHEAEQARAARDALAEHINRVFVRTGQTDVPAKVEEILRHLSETRDEHQRRNAPKKLSDTLEDEHEDERFERPEEGYQTVYHPNIEGSNKASKIVWDQTTEDIRKVGAALERDLASSGWISKLQGEEDTGRAFSSHDLLDHMTYKLDQLQERSGKGERTTRAITALRGMIRSAREASPDVPTFVRSEIVNPLAGTRLGKGAMGLFATGLDAPSIQLALRKHAIGEGSVVRTLIHEVEHAATEHELHRNPNGPVAMQLNHALDILRERTAHMMGEEGHEILRNHIRYFSGEEGAEKPEDFQRQFYGLTNTSEMLTELRSNPRFLQHVIDSEMWASPGENIPKPRGITALLHYIYSAVAKAMGMDDPKLLLHILDLRESVVANQRELVPSLYRNTMEQNRERLPLDVIKNMSQAARASMGGDNEQIKQAEIDDLMGAPRPIKAEGQLRARVGDEGAKTAKETLHAIKSGGIDAVRRGVTLFKTVGQIMRTQRDAFGHGDDPSNPMNELRDSLAEKNKVIQDVRAISGPVARKWLRLKNSENLKVGQLMIDTTQYKIDPRDRLPQQSDPNFDSKDYARRKEYQDRYNALSPEAREVYDGATDANRRIRQTERRNAVGAINDAFDLNLSDAEKRQLVGARDPHAYDRMIGEGKLMDFGDRNQKVIDTLKAWAGVHDVGGPYHHLGRQGEYVVTAEPEGTREFANQAQAEAWADQARQMSPNSKATVEERGGKWVADFKVQHVSMHRTRAEAETMQRQLQEAGFNPGSVTVKNFNRENAPLSSGMSELVTEATRKINKGGGDEGSEALLASLHSAFLQAQAARSAYAGSRLMRKNVGGVKASDMRQNFAEHASGAAWHTGQIATLFKQASAMARLREMARDRDVPQDVAYRRGDTLRALNNHTAMDVSNYGHKVRFNTLASRLGFMSLLASPAHPLIWLTQNATGVAVAGARYGYGKSLKAFGKGMSVVSWPALRSSMNEMFSKHASAEEIQKAVVAAVKSHPELKKWADAIDQLHDRGVISHGYSQELGALAAGEHPVGTIAMEYARLLPSMADAINRVSTAIAGLELTGGDVRKAADLVEEVHADYSPQNKPLAFKHVGRVWGGNSLTMMKTFVQQMAHLTYSNLISATAKGADPAARWTAAKTFGGVLVANAMFAGVYGAIGLEPLRLLLYTYHKIFDEDGEVWDFRNAIHHFLVDHFGQEAGNVLARGPIASALGVDVQDRMGLANLFFHNPPDLLSSDKDMWKTFVFDQLGPVPQQMADYATKFAGHMQRGEYLQAVTGWLPIKVWQDGLKGLERMNNAEAGGGGLDVAKQTFGLKPASVADQQEQQGVKAEYAKARAGAINNLVTQFVEARQKDDKVKMAELRERMTQLDQREQQRTPWGAEIIKRLQNEQLKQKGIIRNPAARSAADFSGS